MCNNCRYCIDFFKTAGIISTLFLVLGTTVYCLYGSMPPTWTMTIGFWLQYVTGWIGVFVLALSTQVMSKIKIKSKVHDMFLFLVIGMGLFYLIAATLCFTPVTRDRMMSYTKNYFESRNKAIPPFLDNFQKQYACCGIRNYKDYNDPEGLDMHIDEGFNQDRVIIPSDQRYYLVEYTFTIHNLINTKHTVRKHREGFDVPTSCCKYGRLINDSNCGKKVVFGRDPAVNVESSLHKINNPYMGCYQKYNDIMERGGRYQLPWLVGLLRWGPLLMGLLYLTLGVMYKLSLQVTKRALERYRVDGHLLQNNSHSMDKAVKENPSNDSISLISSINPSVV